MGERDAELRDRLIAQLRANGALHDPRVTAAFRTVPRHRFVPDLPLEDVYADSAIAIKYEGGVAISSSSQPAMMAMMLEQLAPRAGDRILEIGAGSGYNAALLAMLAGATGFVATIDIDDDLVRAARAHLDAAGFPHVRTICANGNDGAAADAPFDAIIVTVAVDDVAPAWFAQLRPGGRLVVPLAIRGLQKVIGFARREDRFTSTSIVDGAFITARGAAHASGCAEYSESTLPSRYTERAAPFPLGPWEAWSAFALWLALHDEAFCRVFGAFGLCTGREACVVVPHDATIVLRHYGGDESLVTRLRAAFVAWEAAGRPGNLATRIEIFPQRVTAARDAHTAIVERPASTIVARWR